ncbi:MAG: hypothetical protein H7147_12110 [Frankiaceae bacterium]|nr:hypothetical protein [Arenimonas sp.]
MRHLLSVLLLLWAATPLSAADFQMANVRPSLDLSGQDQQVALLAPSLRDWVSGRARAILDSGEDPDPEAIASDANSRLAGQDFSTADIESLVQLVLADAGRQADAALRDMMEQMRAVNQRKSQQREAAPAQREQRDAVSAQARAEFAGRQSVPSCAEPPCQPRLVLVKPRPELAIVGKPIEHQPQAEVDSPSDLGDMESMRLQMYLDRRSKLMETLSNLMKKQSDTASTITSNLK